VRKQGSDSKICAEGFQKFLDEYGLVDPKDTGLPCHEKLESVKSDFCGYSWDNNPFSGSPFLCSTESDKEKCASIRIETDKTLNCEWSEFKGCMWDGENCITPDFTKEFRSTYNVSKGTCEKKIERRSAQMRKQ